MNKRIKRFERILGLKQQYYSFAEVSNFLEYYGFKAKKKGSSHFIFRREGFTHIIIVAHGKMVKKVYVKDAIKQLKYYSILP